jgi:hypothetical protein
MDKVKLANNLLSQKEEGFSISRSIRNSWKRLTFRLALLLIAIYFYFNAAPNEAFLLVIGILLGGTLQDIGWVWRIGKNWNFTKEIINWDKVKEIAKNS